MEVPSKASMAENNTFWDSQPTVLKARVTPMALPSELIALTLRASICAVFAPSTVTSPSVVMTVLSATKASARLWMRLVAMMPPTATPGEPPPVAVAVTSRAASMRASSVAATRNAPASSTTWRTKALACERTSLSATTPPMALAEGSGAASGSAGGSATGSAGGT